MAQAGRGRTTCHKPQKRKFNKQNLITDYKNLIDVFVCVEINQGQVRVHSEYLPFGAKNAQQTVILEDRIESRSSDVWIASQLQVLLCYQKMSSLKQVIQTNLILYNSEDSIWHLKITHSLDIVHSPSLKIRIRTQLFSERIVPKICNHDPSLKSLLAV